MKTLFQLTLVLVVAVTFSACDKVEGPYKKDVVVPTGDRKVLVEDYTGHKCGNCPRASKALYDLKAIYGDNLIVMAVHAGTFATVFPPSAGIYFYEFRNPVGVQLDTDFGISVAGNPNGMVNRRSVNGSQIVSSTKWGDEIATVLNATDPVPVKLSIANAFTASSRQLSTTVTAEYFSDLTGAYKLSVYLVEDSIVNWQKDYDATPEDVEFYVHREVLRGSMNGTYGDAVSETTAGSVKTYNFTYTLDAGWNEEHFSVVAFLYNEATKEIIQVEQEHLNP